MRKCLKGRGGFPPSNDGFILGLPHGIVGRLAFRSFFSSLGRQPAALPVKLIWTKLHKLASNYKCFLRLFHVGRFFLPTYGLLVSLGVLLGMWISVRNSAKSRHQS